MELRTLRYFVAVAEELHFTRAADRLHIAQPALSQQVRALERELGVLLLRRTRRSVALTDAGRAFLTEAREVVRRAESARDVAVRAARGETGKITIGFVRSIGGDLLPQAVRAFRQRWPAVEVDVREMSTDGQFKGLADRALDLGLVHDATKTDRLQFELIRRERLVLALPAQHRLARRATIDLKEMQDDPFVVGPMYTATGRYAQALHTAFDRAGFHPRVVQQASEVATLRVLVAAGVGATLVPRSTMHLRSRDIVYRPMRPATEIELFAARPRDANSPAVDGFLVAVRSAAASEDRGVRRSA